jgi:hypothetical protein
MENAKRDARMTETTALALIERTLPPVWADLWAGRETPRAFRLSSWAKPRTYFLGPANLESIVPGLTRLCPLVERNREAIMGWLPDGRFVEFYYEDASQGDAAIAVLGESYQEFVLSLLLELEDAGLRDEWIDFAAALQFAYTAELIAVLDREIAGEEALPAFRDRIAKNG